MGNALKWTTGQLTTRVPERGSQIKRRHASSQIWCWTLKRDGKVVSGIETALRALAVRADFLQRQGRGGGISSLLLPTEGRGVRRLIRDRAAYQLALVKSRRPGIRQAIREQAGSEALLIEAIQRYPAGERLTVKAFAQWFLREIQKRGSWAHNLARVHAPDLLEAGRSVGWFRRWLRKCRVNKR